NIRRSITVLEQKKYRNRSNICNHYNKESILQIASQRTRIQELNLADTLARFSELLRRALTPPRARIKTHAPTVAKQRRLHEKKKRGLTKQSRSGKGWDS